jgi:hypothetical protein
MKNYVQYFSNAMKIRNGDSQSVSPANSTMKISPAKNQKPPLMRHEFKPGTIVSPLSTNLVTAEISSL